MAQDTTQQAPLSAAQRRFAADMLFHANRPGAPERANAAEEVVALARLSDEGLPLARRASRAWICGDTVAEARAAAELEAFETYLRLRWKGTAPAEAFATAAATHVHHWVATVSDGRDRIMGTGRVVRTYRCDCGAARETVTQHRWSGD